MLQSAPNQRMKESGTKLLIIKFVIRLLFTLIIMQKTCFAYTYIAGNPDLTQLPSDNIKALAKSVYSIYIDGADPRYCSAIAIQPYLLLSAAHCFADTKPQYKQIKYKSITIKNGEQNSIIQAKDIKLYEPQGMNKDNWDQGRDLIIVKITNQVQLKNYVNPTAIHTDLKQLQSDLKNPLGYFYAVAAGGIADDAPAALNFKAASNLEYDYNLLQDNVLLLDKYGFTPTNGDSGGALFFCAEKNATKCKISGVVQGRSYDYPTRLSKYTITAENIYFQEIITEAL